MAPNKRKGAAGDDSAAKPTQKRAKTSTDSINEKDIAKSTTSKPSKPIPAPAVSILRDDEPSFPRGGAGVLNTLEKKRVQKEAVRDVLFKQQDGAQAGSGKSGQAKGRLAPGQTSAHKQKKATGGAEPVDRKESSSSSQALGFSDMSKGMVLSGKISKVTERQLFVKINDNVWGIVPLVEMGDDFSKVDATAYKRNQAIRVCIVDVDKPNKKLVFSVRSSKVLSSSSKVVDRQIMSMKQVKVNDVVRGFIRNITDQGIFVTLGHNVSAYVRVTNLSDEYLKEWKDNYQVDQLVKGKVISVNHSAQQIQLSLKQSALDPGFKAPMSFSDFHEGQFVTGKVRKVSDFGVFIVIDGSANVSGLCHRSQIAEDMVEDASKLYEEGDVVKAKIIKLDAENRKISFGLKASLFEEQGEEDDSDAEESSDGEGGVELESDEDGSADEGDSDEEMDSDDNDDEEENEESDSEPEPTTTKKTKANGLVTGGFDWNGNADKDTAMADTDDEGDAPKKKKKKRPEIKVDKTGDLDANGPQSVADFERLLLGEPDSSYLWLSYMAFQLELGEIVKAREIAERALRTINIGQDAEKMNVWVALLNLENTYGSDEAVEEAFKNACQYNDAQEMHERLTSIYIQSGKADRADDLFQTMVKKFSQDPKIWANYASFLFDTLNAPDRARALLPRAMQSLPSFTHVEVTSKFAQLEYKSANGDVERGRTIFEGLISSFPKRTDLYNILIDLEIKVDDKEQIRRLFERVTSGKLKPKQAQFLFKRWLAWEESEGDKKAVENVRAKAAEFVRAHKSAADA